VTPSELASYLQKDLDASTANLVLTTASGMFSAAADTWWTPTSVTYTRPGTTAGWIRLPFRPITAVTAVRVNSVAITGFTLIQGVLYRASGFGSSWTDPPDVLEVDLTHGYAAATDDVKAAVLDMAALAYDVPVSAVTRESIDDYSVAFNPAANVRLTPSAESLAQMYRGTLVS
jgi:hypothetical protein